MPATGTVPVMGYNQAALTANPAITGTLKKGNTMTAGLGHLPETNLSASFKSKIQAFRGFLTSGLKVRPLATQTIQVTGGNDVTDTFVVKDNSVAIMAAVGWAVSHNNTAALIATAINAYADANPTVSNWVAEVATDTVTIRQRRSGLAAGTISCTVVGDAATTIANAGNPSNDTNTYTPFYSGGTFDGDLYYELAFDATLALHAFNDANGEITSPAPMLLDIDFYIVGQSGKFWSGLQTVSNVITDGYTLAADTKSEKLPWVNGEGTLIVKIAADAVVRYMFRYV